MRMRKRHNLDSRMEKCAELLNEEPEKLRGNWRGEFGHDGKLFLELGCGKGRFTVDTAAGNPDALLIAVEKVPDAMIIAMERAKERELENVRFIEGDAAKLKEMFANGEIDRIYINFCDPWPKSRDAKFRLTAPSFLRIYHDLLSVGGEIHFKTDNTPLFDWSIEQFAAALSEYPLASESEAFLILGGVPASVPFVSAVFTASSRLIFSPLSRNFAS